MARMTSSIITNNLSNKCLMILIFAMKWNNIQRKAQCLHTKSLPTFNTLFSVKSNSVNYGELFAQLFDRCRIAIHFFTIYIFI